MPADVCLLWHMFRAIQLGSAIARTDGEIATEHGTPARQQRVFTFKAQIRVCSTPQPLHQQNPSSALDLPFEEGSELPARIQVASGHLLKFR